MYGHKHLVKCRCVLPQYKNLPLPIQHKFVVFSQISDNEDVIVKYAQCNNCGIIHRITNICVSEIVSGKDHMNSLISIDDIRATLPTNFIQVLEASSADLATWEAVQFIVENKKWGEFVVLSSEFDDGETCGKYIRIFGETLCKIETFIRSSGII